MADNLSFNLVDENWIPVTLLDGTEELLSLSDVFHRLQEVQCLSCELPTMNLVVLRLLLAVTERALALNYDEYDEDDPIALWAELWEADELPLDLIDSYFERWRQRFDLFDPERPFMQDPSIAATNGKFADARKLRSASENKAQLFPMALQRGAAGSRCVSEVPLTMGFDEAARWLLHVQAFDTGSTKTAVVGDPKVKKGRRYGRTGWLGSMGSVYVEGDSLFETLLFNLHLGDSASATDRLFDEEDLPAWERELGGWSSERLPAGFADIYTWQSRRVRLAVDEDDGRVADVVLTHGDALGVVNMHEFEPMSSWRRNKKPKKSLREPVAYAPVMHNPERALWRGIGSLIGWSDGTFRPGILQWLGNLIEDPDVGLPQSTILKVRAVGFTYGKQNACIDDAIDDALGIPAALLSPANESLVTLVLHCADAAQDAVCFFGRYVYDLARISGAGKDEPGKKSAARERESSARSEAYFAVGELFSEWLGSLGGDVDPVQARNAWFDAVRRELMALAAQRLSAVGPQVFAGRVWDGTWMNAAGAERKFKSSLNKVLPSEPRGEEVNGGGK